MAQLHHFPNEESTKLEQKDEQKTPETRLLNSPPIIDLAGIDGPEHERICQEIAGACETWGFFHLVNHGIDQCLLKRVKDVTMEFFHRPEEEKSKIKVQFIEGWNPPKNSIEGNAIQKNTVENMYLTFYPERESCDRYPQQPPSYIPTLKEYTKELKVLGEKILRILSEMLGLEPEALQTAVIAGSATQAVQMGFRSNFYGLNEDGDALPNVCLAHSDPGSLTILLADDVPGLELEWDGQWVPVNPIPGGLIVNVANMVEVCSNGRYKSIYHRGLPSSKRERLSLANFQMPELDAVIAPIPLLLDDSHPPLYKSFTFGEFLASSLKRGLNGAKGLELYKL